MSNEEQITKRIEEKVKTGEVPKYEDFSKLPGFEDRRLFDHVVASVERKNLTALGIVKEEPKAPPRVARATWDKMSTSERTALVEAKGTVYN
jgi:hypothetical protein